MAAGLSTAALATLPAGAVGCCPCTLRTEHTWNNAISIGGTDPDVVERPESLPELVELIRRAEREEARLRMVGSGHSFSDVAYTDDVLLLPHKLNRVLTLDRSLLKTRHRNDTYLVRVESGMRIRELNQHLWKEGLALPIMGGYDAQTIAGATSTGTHGSSLEYGAIGDSIVSFELVTKGGAVIVVEPSDGITDPARFPGYVETPSGRVAARLEQDDVTFRALSVGLGCMGVIYAVTARMEPKYWLSETRKLLTWGEVRDGFLARLLSKIPEPGRPYRPERLDPASAEDPVYYEVYFNPYPPKPGGAKESHRCILTERRKILTPPSQRTPEEKKRGKFGLLVGDIMAELSGRGALIVDYMNHNPDRVPALIDDALGSLEDEIFIDRSYKVFDLGPPNKVRVYGIEMAFDIRQTVDATERLFDIAAELARDGKRHCTPPSLRFVGRTDAHLAMNQGRETMLLEMGMMVCANGDADLLRHYERTFMREMGARPHWGLDLKVLDDFRHVRNLYPDTAVRWRSVYERFNEKGTFNGAFTDRLRISMND